MYLTNSRIAEGLDLWPAKTLPITQKLGIQSRKVKRLKQMTHSRSGCFVWRICFTAGVAIQVVKLRGMGAEWEG